MPRTTEDEDIDRLTPVIPVKRDDGYENPFEIIDSPWGHIERWRASTLSTGTMGCLAEVYQVVRNDAAELKARADAMEARKGLVQHLCDRIAGMHERITRLEDALEARHKADAEREEREAQEREFEEEPLTLPPDIAEKQALAPPTEIENDRDSDEYPGISKDPGELPEPSLELEDSLGDLPEPLRDLPDPVPPPKSSVVQQPVAISLTEE